MKTNPTVFILSTFLLSSCALFGGNSSMSSLDSESSNSEESSSSVETTSSVESSSSAQQSSTQSSATITIEKDTGYTLKFNNVGADYYLVKDNNDYRDEVRINGNTNDEYFTYTPEVVGSHEVYVEAYNSSGTKIGKSAKINSVEVEPVYCYSPFSAHYSLTKNKFKQYGLDDSLYQQAEEFSGRSSPTHYYFLDDNLNWTARGSMNLSDESQKYDEIDFSSSPHFDTVLQNLKDTGQNVLLLHTHYASIPAKAGSVWWYQSDDDNAVLRYMDRAWARGIKTIVTDNLIFEALNKGSNTFTGNHEDLKNDMAKRMKSRIFHQDSTQTDLTKIIRHKGFYGFNCPDEPRFKSPTYYALAYAAAYVEELYSSNKSLQKYNKPVMFTNFLPYDLSCFDSSTENYKEYIREWAELSGTDYWFYDMYNYTTHPYGGTDENGNLRCPVKDAYTQYDAVRKEFPNLKVCQTINCGNLNNNSYQDQTTADIFACHFTTTAAKFNGHALFTFSPFDIGGTWENNAVNCNQTKTDSFDKFVKASKQVEIAKGLLDGYSLTSMNFDQNPQNAYGPGKKLMKSEFSNGTNKATMYVNYETDAKNPINADVSLSGNKFYFEFGDEKEQNKVDLSSSKTITLKPGEALLVFDK